MKKVEIVKAPWDMFPEDKKTMRAVITHIGLKYKRNEAIVIFKDKDQRSFLVASYNFSETGELRQVREAEILENINGNDILFRIFKFRDSFAKLSRFLQLRQMVSYLYLSYKARKEVRKVLSELEVNYKRPNSKHHEQRKNP
jgi:hypothetical protein